MPSRSTPSPPATIPRHHLEQAAECFRVMAHPLRLRIVETLLSGDYCVREISARIGLSEHQTCEHLRLMKAHGLLASERRGRAVHYKIANPRLPRLMDCIRATCLGGTQPK